MSVPPPTVGRTMTYHPWRHLRSQPHLTLEWTELPDGYLAVSSADTIWMEQRQRQAQRRSTLTHELVHREHGDVGCQPPSVEAQVEEVAARKLIPLAALAEAIVWAMSEEELAVDLWVDLGMVHTRLATLTTEESGYIEDVINRREAAL